MTEGTEHGIEVVFGGLLFVLGLALLLWLFGMVSEQMQMWERIGAGLGTGAQMGVFLWKL